MPDDLKKSGYADGSRISIEQPHEVSYWSRRLGCTPDELRQAVRRAGPMVKDVRRQLGK